MQKKIIYIFIFFLYSCTNGPCGCNNPCPTDPNKPVDRNITIINKTGHDNLKVYFVHNSTISACSDLIPLVVVNKDQTFSYHVPPGETHAIYFGAPGDLFCSDYAHILVKGIYSQSNQISIR